VDCGNRISNNLPERYANSSVYRVCQDRRIRAESNSLPEAFSEERLCTGAPQEIHFSGQTGEGSDVIPVEDVVDR